MHRYAGRFCIRCLNMIIFWIFGVFVPKGQMGFNFESFPKFGVLPRFACHPIFFSFLGTMWFVDLDDPFGYPSDHVCALCYIGMCVASVLLSRFWLSDFMFMFSSSPCVDLRVGGAPHTRTSVG